MVAFWGTSRTSRLSFVVDFHTQPWAKCKLLHQLTLKPTGNTDNVHPAHGGKTQVRARDISRHELRVTWPCARKSPAPANRGYGMDCDASQRQLRDSTAACENKGFRSIGVRVQCCLTLTRGTLFPEITPRHTSSQVHQNARTGHRQRKKEA